ncbi:carboxypeptidase-like regulatory domain-containing protein [Rhodothermus marinus]|uniref:carboxypeptidase-like regulatory domain-containing protein n=1 Tax=Rhodothermus marinus TaxID=29549 RepID=UPI0037C78D81
MRILPIPILLALLLSPSAPPHADDQLTGTVTYGPGFPLEGARVYALEPTRAETLATGTTDAAGMFTLTLPAGTATEPLPSDQTYRIVALYPRPVQEGLRLQVHYAAPPTEKAPPVPELFDITGRQLPPEVVRTAGVYFLRLRFASGRYTSPRSFVQTARGAPEIVLLRTEATVSGAGKRSAGARDVRLRIVHPHFAPFETVLTVESGTPVHVEAALTPTTALLTPTATRPGNLLFAITAPPDLMALYFGLEQNDTLQITHLLLQQGEQLHGVVFNESHHPIQWIGDSVTVAVRRLRRDPFDPSRAFLAMVYQGTEDTLTLDLSDRLLAEVLDRFENVASQSFSEARSLADAFPTWSLDSLVARAYRPSVAREDYLAAATAFRTAHAAWRLREAADTLVGAGKQLYGQALAIAAKYLVQVAAASLAHIVNRELGPGNPNDPTQDLPQLPVLLCRGAAKYGLCHYLFFRYLGSSEPCVSFCKTSLRCFSDICQPQTLDMQRALALREAY